MAQYNQMLNKLASSTQLWAKYQAGILNKFFTIFVIMFCVVAFTACSDDSKKEEQQQEQTNDVASPPSIEPNQTQEGEDVSVGSSSDLTTEQSASNTDAAITASDSETTSTKGQDAAATSPSEANTASSGDNSSNDANKPTPENNASTTSQQPTPQDHEMKIIKVGTSPDYKPLEFVQEGQLVGFEIDIANKVFSKMSYKVEFVQMPFYSLIAALQANKVDAVVSGMSITDERKEYVNFSVPYYNESNSIVFKKSAEQNKRGLFSGAKIGVQSGSTQENMLKIMLPKYQDIKVESRDSNPQVIEDLRMDKIDSAIVLSSIAQELIRNDDIFMMENIDVDAETKKDFGTAFALPKDSLLVEPINEAIQELIKTGEVEKIAAKWNM